MNLNKVMLIGRLTRDPELRSTAGGQPVASFGLATNRNWTSKDGQKQEEVEFHNIVVWARQAEVVSQFLKKGQLAYIEGRLQTRSWQDKEGQSKKTTEIVADRVQFGPKASGVQVPAGERGVAAAVVPGNTSAQNSGAQAQPSPALPEINIDEDDIKPEEVPF